MRFVPYCIVVLLAVCLWCRPVSAETVPLTIGYLEYGHDLRYREAYTEARFPAQPWGRPLEAAEMAIRETRFAAMSAGVEFRLERRVISRSEDLAATADELMGRGGRFFLLDLPGDMVAELAARTRGKDLLLFNLSALDDTLRQQQCQSHLMHIAPSRVMLTDAIAQYLVFKKWRNLLVLKGSQPGDAEYHEAFKRSAKRFGLRTKEERDFALGRDPRERSKNNIGLLTAGVDYDALYVIDAHGEFARDVPYQGQKPRVVVGAAGLVADWWHWAWERNGAPQVNKRFREKAKRPMTGYDWSAWVAVKIISEALVRSGSREFDRLLDYIRGEEIVIDGSKGYSLNFRSWNNQLRQPIFLTTPNWVVERAPLSGFLHQTNNLDTLGFDERENACRF